jgi:hypothetical protein
MLGVPSDAECGEKGDDDRVRKEDVLSEAHVFLHFAPAASNQRLDKKL